MDLLETKCYDTKNFNQNVQQKADWIAAPNATLCFPNATASVKFTSCRRTRLFPQCLKNFSVLIEFCLTTHVFILCWVAEKQLQ